MILFLKRSVLTVKILRKNEVFLSRVFLLVLFFVQKEKYHLIAAYSQSDTTSRRDAGVTPLRTNRPLSSSMREALQVMFSTHA